MKVIFFKFYTSQKKRLKKNFFSHFSSATLQMIIQFFYPPLMIIFWGVENFGVWIFITAIPTTLAMFNVNFAGAARTEMSIFDVKKKVHKVKEVFSNAFALIFFNMAIFTLIVTIAFLFVDLDFNIFKNIDRDELNTILLLIILSFYFEILDSIFITGISYWGRLHQTINIRIFFELIIKSAVILAGIFFESLLYAAIIFFFCTVLKSIVYYYYYLLNNKYLSLSIKLSSMRKSIKLFKLSLSYYSEMMTNIVKHNGQVILFGLFFNAQIITLVSTCKTLFYFFPIRLIGIFFYISIYEYSQTYAKKKFLELKHNHKVHLILILILIIMFVIGSLTIGPIIYNFWLNNEFDLSLVFLALIVLDASILIVKNTIIISIKSINRFFKVSFIEFLICVFSLLISYYYLSLGYSFISFFVISLIGTILILLISIYFTLKFYKRLN